MKSTTQRLPNVLRRLIAAQVLGIYAAATLVPTAVLAVPIVPPASLAQVPQFLQFPPPPNVFITVDNSGSMTAEILPDPPAGDNTTPQRMFPMPLRSPYAADGNGQADNNLTGAGLRFAGFSHHINVARLRSAAQNLMYYDPRIRYQPWKTADAAGAITSYAEAADPANGDTIALFNPVFPGHGGLDLAASTIALGNYTVFENALNTSSGTYTARFDASNGSSATTPFALYYTFDTTRAGCDTSSPTASRNDLDCYERVEVKPAITGYAIPAGNQRGNLEPGCALAAGVMTCNYNAEFRNFANWFQYYRARTLLARGAMGNSVADLGNGFRIGLGLINPTSNSTGAADGFNSTTVRLGVRDFTGANRKPFFDLLHNHDAAGTTPSGSALTDVGLYFDWKTGGSPPQPVNTGPWSNDPAAGLAEFASCRQSYHVYSTDGYWNENANNLFNGSAAPALNADGTAAAEICRPTGAPVPPGQPACYTYRPGDQGATSGTLFTDFGAPGHNNLGNPNNRRFVSSEQQSLADIAMYFWYRDLQPGMPNNVSQSTANPAFWQNLPVLAVALGFTGTVTGQGEPFLQGLDGGTGAWPTGLTPNGGDPKTADDLWHAAVNSRGRLLTANNPQALSAQLAAALQEIRARAAIGSAAASSTAFLDAGNGIFTAEISQGTWTGNLYRREIDPATRRFKTTNGGVPAPVDANGVPYVWRASDLLAAPAARPIFTMRTETSPRGSPVAFVANSGTIGVDAAQMADLVGPQSQPAADVISYLRGDRTKELSALPPGTFRDRPRLQASAPGSLNNVFGTFANSSPVFVRDEDFGYDFLPASTATQDTGRETYLAFLRANQGNSTTPGRTGTIWAGSNEGMMHAFNADTGAELFSYVPRSAIPNLPLLVDPQYQHRFLVDGVPALGDAYLAPPNGGAVGWRTVVVSSLGAGGRAVFAIDATRPTDLVSAGANNIYWEADKYSLSTADYELLGHTFGPPFIARIKDDSVAAGGRWVAVFGNGPESDRKRAALFVVDLQSGSVVRVLDTGNGDAANPNGLSTPSPLFDANRQLVGVYAGDLRGNLWKFDLSGPNPSAWNVAFSGNPLFTTMSPANVGPVLTQGQAQPIFAKPLLRRHPDGGIMVIFGTGKMFSPGDRENQDIQSLYGVWDKPLQTTGLGNNFRSAGSLVQQAITSKSGTPTLYFMTNFGVSYVGGMRGWFIDLGVSYNVAGNAVNTGSATVVTARERMIVGAISIGRFTFAQSFVPSVDSCDQAGLSFVYGLNFETGGFVGTGSFRNTNNTGAIAMDGAFGMLPLLQRPVPGSNTADRLGLLFSVTSRGDLAAEEFNPGGLGAFRTWRQLLD